MAKRYLDTTKGDNTAQIGKKGGKIRVSKSSVSTIKPSFFQRVSNKINKLANLPTMAEFMPGNASTYGTYGYKLPRVQTTVGSQARRAVDTLTAPVMLGRGVIPALTRLGYGASGLAGERGINRTVKKVRNKEYGKAALSGFGDLLNTALMFSAVPDLATSPALQSIYNDAFRVARTASNAAKQPKAAAKALYNTVKQSIETGKQNREIRSLLKPYKSLNASELQKYNGLTDDAIIRAVSRGRRVNGQPVRIVRNKYGKLDYDHNLLKLNASDDFGSSLNFNVLPFINKKGQTLFNSLSDAKTVLGNKPVPYMEGLVVDIPKIGRWKGLERYRDELETRLINDWNNNGPLRSHLERSGIEDPRVLMKYLLTPEEAAENGTFSQAAMNVTLDNYLSHDVSNKGLNEFASNLLSALEGKGYKGSKDAADYLSTYDVGAGAREFITDLYDDIRNAYNSGKTSIAKSQADDVVNQVVKEFYKNSKYKYDLYKLLEPTFKNAYSLADTKRIYMPLYNELFATEEEWAAALSHELAHSEELRRMQYPLYGLLTKGPQSFRKGIIESDNTTYTTDDANKLARRAFDFDKIIDEGRDSYFLHPNEVGSGWRGNLTELLARGTQLKDAMRLKKGDRFTRNMLEMLSKTYPKFMNNNMIEFFDFIKDWDAAAKFIDIYSKAMLPIGIGAGGVAGSRYLEDKRSLQNRGQYANGRTIHINPANRGKFNALKKRTGKTTEELTHSKNPLTRKRAIFAQNARKWNH